jgi:UDPglucose 6-dehydrogenase
VIEKLQHHLPDLNGKRVALLGLSFKPNTDDLREAPSLHIARSLDSLGVTVVGYDPVAGENAAALLPDGAKVVFDPYEALEGAHAAVLVTEWENLKVLKASRVASLMRDPRLIVDGRNVLDPDSWREAGLRYVGFGRE